MRKLHLILFWSLVPFWVSGQTKMHSHNDYLQAKPFETAFLHGFHSIEADLILRNDTLFVAHEEKNIKPQQTFSYSYLRPAIAGLNQQKHRKLQLLLDLKTDYHRTLPRLISALSPYKKKLHPRGNLIITISGNTPPPKEFKNYPKFIQFDGRPETVYTRKQLKRVALISQSFRNYSWWNGRDELSEKDRNALNAVISKIHQQKKPVRFWATPDHEKA